MISIWLGCLGAFYFRMLGLYKKISTFKNQQFIHANHYLTCSGHYSFNFPQLLLFLPLAKKWGGGGFSPPSPPPCTGKFVFVTPNICASIFYANHFGAPHAVRSVLLGGSGNY